MNPERMFKPNFSPEQEENLKEKKLELVASDENERELTPEEEDEQKMFEHMKENMNIAPVKTEEELREMVAGDTDLESLLEAFLRYAGRYAKDVWEMEKAVASGIFNTEDGAKEFAEMDDKRTILHTALVDSVAIFSRALYKKGMDNEWVRELTDGAGLSRAACGAFALSLVLDSANKRRQQIENEEDLSGGN